MAGRTTNVDVGRKDSKTQGEILQGRRTKDTGIKYMLFRQNQSSDPTSLHTHGHHPAGFLSCPSPRFCFSFFFKNLFIYLFIYLFCAGS